MELPALTRKQAKTNLKGSNRIRQGGWRASQQNPLAYHPPAPRSITLGSLQATPPQSHQP